MSFESFAFPEKILNNIKRMGYTTPTPIQTRALPPVLEGRDVMGLAQTGTGKTAAFVLPILNRIMTTPAKGPGPRALIVAPTRELAEQIHQSVRDLGQGIRLRSATVYGGVGLFPQTRALRQGVDIVVACPGRLLDHIKQGNVRFPALEVLVLDEADHMFDMGFLPDIRRILGHLPASRQTLLFSATMPDSIQGLARDILSDPVTVEVSRQAPPAMVSHALYPVESSRKTPLLLELLGRAERQSVIVFTRTKHRAKNLALHLGQAGHKAACIQGNLSQSRRQEAMDGFRAGRYQILVATDIAARGIDVSKVGHVINYDIPDTPEAYLHRIGRTGRAECEGQAHTLVTSEDRSMVRAIESMLGKRLDRCALEGFGSASILDGPAGAYPSGPRPGSSRGGQRPGAPRYGDSRSSDRRPSGFAPRDRSGLGPDPRREAPARFRDQEAAFGRDPRAPRPEGRPRAGGREAWNDGVSRQGEARMDSRSAERSGGRAEARPTRPARSEGQPRQFSGRPEVEGNREFRSQPAARPDVDGNRDLRPRRPAPRDENAPVREDRAPWDGPGQTRAASGRPRRENQEPRTEKTVRSGNVFPF